MGSDYFERSWFLQIRPVYIPDLITSKKKNNFCEKLTDLPRVLRGVLRKEKKKHGSNDQ